MKQNISDKYNLNQTEKLKYCTNKNLAINSMEQKTLWLRLGVSVSCSEEEIAALMNGDHDTLVKIIDQKRFVVDGDSYIPSVCVAEYNDKYGTNYDEGEINL